MQLPAGQLGALFVHHSIRGCSTLRKPTPLEIVHDEGRHPVPLKLKRPLRSVETELGIVNFVVPVQVKSIFVPAATPPSFA